MIKNILLRWLLKDTWHCCNHEFVTKAVDLKADWVEQECKKCHVNATTQYRDTRLILIDPISNHPFKFDPWGVTSQPTKGIRLSTKQKR